MASSTDRDFTRIEYLMGWIKGRAHRAATSSESYGALIPGRRANGADIRAVLSEQPMSRSMAAKAF